MPNDGNLCANCHDAVEAARSASAQMKSFFHSQWRGELQEFINFRRTYLTSEWPEAKLRLFDTFASAHPHVPLPEVIALWLQRDATRNPKTRHNDLIAIRQFCVYRRRFDPAAFVPESVGPSAAVRSYVKA